MDAEDEYVRYAVRLNATVRRRTVEAYREYYDIRGPDDLTAEDWTRIGYTSTEIWKRVLQDFRGHVESTTSSGTSSTAAAPAGAPNATGTPSRSVGPAGGTTPIPTDRRRY